VNCASDASAGVRWDEIVRGAVANSRLKAGDRKSVCRAEALCSPLNVSAEASASAQWKPCTPDEDRSAASPSAVRVGPEQQAWLESELPAQPRFPLSPPAEQRQRAPEVRQKKQKRRPVVLQAARQQEQAPQERQELL